MDIISAPNNAIKIKTKNATFVVNPVGKVETEVAVMTVKPSGYADLKGLVIDGPGEYEVAGVSIKGEKIQDKVSFDFLEENQRFIVIPSSASMKEIETDGYTAAAVIMDEKVEPFLSSVTAEVVALVGSDEFLPTDRTNVKKSDKINLKKTEEHKGFVVHLSK